MTKKTHKAVERSFVKKLHKIKTNVEKTKKLEQSRDVNRLDEKGASLYLELNKLLQAYIDLQLTNRHVRYNYTYPITRLNKVLAYDRFKTNKHTRNVLLMIPDVIKAIGSEDVPMGYLRTSIFNAILVSSNLNKVDK